MCDISGGKMRTQMMTNAVIAAITVFFFVGVDKAVTTSGNTRDHFIQTLTKVAADRVRMR